jgi:hypothetical protein
MMMTTESASAPAAVATPRQERPLVLRERDRRREELTDERPPWCQGPVRAGGLGFGLRQHSGTTYTRAAQLPLSGAIPRTGPEGHVSVSLDAARRGTYARLSGRRRPRRRRGRKAAEVLGLTWGRHTEAPVPSGPLPARATPLLWGVLRGRGRLLGERAGVARGGVTAEARGARRGDSWTLGGA